MTLRTRLLLLISGSLLLLALGAWWGVRRLTAELSAELGEVAMSVGRSIVAVFSSSDEEARKVLERLPAEHRARVEQLERAEQPGQVQTWSWRSSADDGGARQAEARVIRIVERSSGSSSEAGVAEVAAVAAPGRLDFVLETSKDAPSQLRLIEHDRLVHRIPIPSVGVESAVERFSQRLLAGALGLLLVVLIGTAVVVHRATAPLARLAEAAGRLGEGKLGERVGNSRGASSEVAAAIGAFDHMSARLAELDAETRWLREREHLGELGEVARAIAHSLRNPLNALGLTIDRLAHEAAAGGSDEVSELSRGARQQIRRLDASIRSILALAADRGADPAPVELGRVCRDVALEAAQDSGGRVRVAVEVDGDPRLGAGVPAELRAIVQALVVNAIEASPDAELVAIRASGGQGQCIVEVEDRGAGVAPEVQLRLFEPHNTTKPTGSGMGLFIASRLAATRYGGKVELLERDGGGTVARVTLQDPAARNPPARGGDG